MINFRILLAFLAPVAIGYLVMATIDRKHSMSWYEKIILGYFPGIGILMTSMFLMGLLSVRLTLANVSIWMAAVATVLAVVMWKFRPATSNTTQKRLSTDPIDLIILSAYLIILAYKVGLAVVFTLQSPTYQDDSLLRWNMRAKVFYYRGELVLDRQDPEYLGQPGWRGDTNKKVRLRAYPPHTCLYKTWIALAMGRYKDEAVNLVNPVTYGFFCLSVMLLLSRIVGMRRALIGGYLILAIPYLWIHASNPYAEIFVTSYCTLACLSFLTTIELQDQNAYLWYFAFCLTFLIGTKKEGLVLSLIIVSVYLFWCIMHARAARLPSSIKAIRFYLLPVALFGVMIIIWFAYQNHIDGAILFKGHRGSGSGGIFLRPQALSAFKEALFREGTFSLFPVLLTAVSIWKIVTIYRSNLKYIYLAFLTMLAAVVFQLSFTASYFEAIKGTGINRALIEILPTGILSAFISISYQQKAEERDSKFLIP